MNVVVSLAPGGIAKPEVGDIVTIQLFVDEKVGSPGDGWEVAAQPGTLWQQAGGVTVSTMSVRALPVEGNATKLELDAMVHQPGALVVGPLRVRNQVTKTELEVPMTTLSGTEAAAGAKPEQEPPWVLPAVGFGGWDWTVVGVVAAAILAVALAVARHIRGRLRRHLERKLTTKERALNALSNMQKYLRSRKPLELDEWKKFSFELAGILRRYSDETFMIDSSDMTDRELLHELQSHPMAATQATLLAAILGTITEVRYGRKNLDASVIPGLLLDSKRFVESTSPGSRAGGAG